MPTLALVKFVAFNQMGDPEKEFSFHPGIRHDRLDRCRPGDQLSLSLGFKRKYGGWIVEKYLS
jgi:hypothetical protein